MVVLESEQASDRRVYAQLCPIARALDAVGERWTLLIVRNLLVGPMRYGELLDGLPGITTNLLAKRLKELTARGLLQTREAHRVTLYELTPRGRALEAALLALSSWGEAEAIPEGGHRNLRWAMLGLRLRYQGGVHAVIMLTSTEPDRRFVLEFGPTLEFSESLTDKPDVQVTATEAALFSMIYGKQGWRPLYKSGALQIEGKKRLLDAALRATKPYRAFQ